MSVTHCEEVHLLLSADIYKVDLLSAACHAEWVVWVGAGFKEWEHLITFKGEMLRVCQVCMSEYVSLHIIYVCHKRWSIQIWVKHTFLSRYWKEKATLFVNLGILAFISLFCDMFYPINIPFRENVVWYHGQEEPGFKPPTLWFVDKGVGVFHQMRHIFVSKFMQKCIRTNWGELHQGARQWSKVHRQHQRTSSEGEIQTGQVHHQTTPKWTVMSPGRNRQEEKNPTDLQTPQRKNMERRDFMIWVSHKLGAGTTNMESIRKC